ncbi:MAG: DUF45 domain-containing protein [Candidatus Izemoplasma sp.]
MKQILLGNKLVSYHIVYKNNKNTYFRFKSDGSILITASKKQSTKEILKFMVKHQEKIFDKLKPKKNNRIISIRFEESVKIFNIEYKVVLQDGPENIFINLNRLVIQSNNKDIDHIDKMYNNFIKKLLLEEVSYLQKTYRDTVGFNIDNIKFKTRYTQSRYGSCNPHLRTINFNLHLIHFDKKFLKYVFLHEIAHLVHQNHSPKFYNLLESICIKYKIYKKELNILFNL